jgi:endonuclease-3
MALHDLSLRLKARFPNARYALDWSTPLELLVATILAAQSTDERVNQVTRGLFARYRDAAAFAAASVNELAQEVKSTGLGPSKAKMIVEACRILVQRHDGQVPRTMEAMLTLPGVGRKTANVVLVTAYGLTSGVIVDTHVKRVATRLGLSAADDADAIERDLMRDLPRAEWLWWPAAVIAHGRATCTARRPDCGTCLLADLCPRIGVPATS